MSWPGGHLCARIAAPVGDPDPVRRMRVIREHVITGRSEPAINAVGAVAPDFLLPGATKEGLTAGPVHLSDFKDQLVVIAFFFQARTKG